MRSTLRQAADLDHRALILADGCLDASPELHRVLIQKVFPRQAEVARIADWPPAWAGQDPAQKLPDQDDPYAAIHYADAAVSRAESAITIGGTDCFGSRRVTGPRRE